MAMTVTPGYDFTPQEIPTKVKLETMILGMSITGIDISQIDANLVANKFEANTAVSLPAEGWINYDQIGRIWVKTANGDVCIHRGNWGGWETKRYRALAALDTYTYPINSVGPIGELRTSVVASSNESNVGYRPGTSNVGRFVFKNIDSAASGAFIRIVGRGGHLAEVLTTNRTGFPDYIRRSDPTGQQDQEATAFPAIETDAYGLGRKQALALRQHPSAGVRCVAWWFGYELMQD